MQRSMLDGWTPADFAALENGVLVAHHRLHESGMFDDDALAELIDRHPAHSLTISTMGGTADRFNWSEVDRNGVSGAELLDLVRRGRLWINIRRLMDHHPQHRDVILAMYDEMDRNCPGRRSFNHTANLLVSSPTAIVPYHTDVPVNMLWHIRGSKRVWVYPPFDSRFLPQESIEEVVAAAAAEEIPYDPSLDRYALSYDLWPGEMVTWPQNTPHRVTNLAGVNVSLSTEHYTPAARRRNNIHFANRFLRRQFGFPCRSTRIEGPAALCKVGISRAVRFANRWTKKPERSFHYPVRYRLDIDSADGVVPIGSDTREPVLV